MTDKEKFDDLYGAAHWLTLRQLMVALVDFKATVLWHESYDQQNEQFLINFPDGTSRLGTVLNEEWDNLLSGTVATIKRIGEDHV